MMRSDNYVTIKMLPGAFSPERAHPDDAGLDLKAMEGKVIKKRTGETFDTGICMEIPEGWFGKIESRSGLNINHGVVSCGGVIDSNYRGSIRVKLYNFGDEDYEVKPGDKIAQLILIKHASYNLELVKELPESDRGENGFGSSGR